MLKMRLRPEFLNRIDETIVFQPLSATQMTTIMHILLGDLRGPLTKQGLSLELTKGAEKWLAEAGFDPQFGARPMKRTLQKTLVNEISKYLLAGTFQKGETILVDADTVGLIFGRKRTENGKEIITRKVELI